jgi:hypothetical protein
MNINSTVNRLLAAEARTDTSLSSLSDLVSRMLLAHCFCYLASVAIG